MPLRRRLEIAATKCIDTHIGGILLVRQIIDADKWRQRPVTESKVGKPGTQVHHAVGIIDGRVGVVDEKIANIKYIDDAVETRRMSVRHFASKQVIGNTRKCISRKVVAIVIEKFVELKIRIRVGDRYP